MELREKIKALAQAALPLEYDAERRSTALEAVRDYAESFLETVAAKPVYTPDARDTADVLGLDEESASMSDALAILAEHVDQSGLNIRSSRYFAFIPSGGLYPAALGDFLGAAINRYTGVRFPAPGATRLERAMLRWLADEVGYPPGSEGDLTSGGSIANLSGIVAARRAHDIRARDVERAVVYMTRLTHHSVAKALGIAGLAECRTRFVPLDRSSRMEPAALEKAIVADHDTGLLPWLIVGTAGTTDLGTVDPLDQLADIAVQHDMWLHVDAAYGGAFALCEEGKRRLRGLDRSASLVLDPHKGFFLPYGSGVVLVRNGARLYEAYHARGSYMQDLQSVSFEADASTCDFSPELTRPFRGLRLWLPLKLIGLAPFRAALEEKLLLAEYFYDQIETFAGFEIGPRPDLSVVAFRYVPKRGDANEFNRRLADAIRNDGRIFLSTTTLDGVFTLRMAILCYHSHLEDVDIALQTIQEQARRLAGE